MAGNTMTGVSLIVATLGEHDIRPLLNSLEVQSCDKYECIVIDQSKERIVEPILSGYKHINYVHSTRKGNSFNRNIGIRHAKMSIIAFPDDDCYYSPDVIEKVIDAFDNHPDIDGVSGNWLDSETGELVIGGQHNSYVNVFNLWTSVTNLTFFMRFEAVKNVNGYDENFGLGSGVFEGGEETDYILKFLENENKILFDSHIRVWHRQDKYVINNYEKKLGYEVAWGALFRKWSCSGNRRAVVFLTFLFLVFKSFMGSLFWLFRGNLRNSWFYLVKNRARLQGWIKYEKSLKKAVLNKSGDQAK